MPVVRTLGLLLTLCCLPVSLFAANYVFVFHSSATTASVYNADTLELVATPTVGTGARRAFGVPDPFSPTQFLKFYVLTNNSIVVLNPAPPFSVRATLPFSGSVASAPNAAVLSGDGRHLLVAAGSQVHVVRTNETTDGFAATIPTFGNPQGIAVWPNSRRAYVFSTGSSVLQIIELGANPPQLISTTVSIPQDVAPTALAMAPNGSRLYAAVPGSVYEIDRSNNVSTPITNTGFSTTSIVFDPDPPVAAAVLNNGANASILNLQTRTVGGNPFTAGSFQTISEVVAPGGNRVFLLAGGRLYQGFAGAGGPTFEVFNPATALPFGTGGVDVEATPDGRRIFAAFVSENRLVRVEPASLFASAQATLTQAPTGLSLAFEPATQAGLFEIYGGNSQSSPSGVPFPGTLAVRARASNPHPVFGTTVTFSTSASGVLFSDQTPATNLHGVAETQVQLPVSTQVTVNATISSGGTTFAVAFTLNGVAPTPEGLTKVSGNRQMVAQNTPLPFPLVVLATNFGAPVAGLTLSVSAPAPLTLCPATVVTDLNGIGTIDGCMAGAASSNTQVDVGVSDSLARSLADPFRVTILADANHLPASLVVQNDTPIRATVRQTLANGVRLLASRESGVPVESVGIVLTSQQDLTLNPTTLVTDSSGQAAATVTFGCFVGSGSIRAQAMAPGNLVSRIDFVTSPGPVTQMLRSQGDGQRGNPGTRLPLAAKVRLADICGNGRPGEAVSWRVEPAAAATLENVIASTDANGESSVLVRLGTRPGPFTVVATSGGLSATFSLAINIVASRLALVSGNNQSLVVGQLSADLVVETQDDNGIAAGGVDVTFRVASGTGTLSTARGATDAQGRTSTRVQSSVLGVVTVEASAVGRTVTFTITVVGRLPVVTTLGFVNGASFRVGWPLGGLGTIFGSGLMEGVTGIVTATTAPFPTTLRGVRVVVNGIDAPIISISNMQGTEQINIQVPFGLSAPGTVRVEIHNNGSTATFTVPIFALMPGIFEFPQAGTLFAAALHSADFSVVTPSNPARRGEIILLFLTGLGVTRPPVGTNVAGPVPPAESVARPVVGINDAGAEVLGSFYAPGLYTAYQINFRIPLDAPTGNVKISVGIDSVFSQDSRISIQP